MEKGKQKKTAIGRPKSKRSQKGQTTQTKKTSNPPRKSARKNSRSIQKGQTTQTKKTSNPPRKSARKSERFSDKTSETERDAADSARPNASGTTTKIKIAGGIELETPDVWSVRILVTAVSLTKVFLTIGLVTFFLANPDKVTDAFQLALKAYGECGVRIGSIIIDLICGSREKFLNFQKDFEDGKVKEALENELSKIGYDAKLEVTLMKVTRNVARTEMRTVSQGESKAEKESNQKVEVKKIPEGTDSANKEDIQLPSQKRKEDNSDVEDGSPPKRRRPLSSSASDPKRNKATAEASELSAKEPAVVEMILAGSSGIEQPEDIITMDNRGNLNMREPPELRETLKVLEMRDLPPKTTPWKDIEEKFLPVDFLLLTAKECEHLSCLSFLDDIKMGDDDKLGPVYFGFNSSKSKIAVIKCAMGTAGPGGSIVVVQGAVPILRPKAVICVGYCASLDEKKAKLGDVIVPAKLITCALTKVRENKIEHLGYVLPPNTKMAKRIKVAGAGWIAPLKNPEDLKVTVRNDGVLLSGPTVFDNSELRRELNNRFLQGTAIEMEGEGLYAAAHNHGIEWLVIKGVSDFDGDNKSATDSWRPFASVMAASLVAHMLNDSIAFENWRHYGGESYAEAAQPGPSNQGEPRSIRPGDKAPTTYKGVSDFGDDNKSATYSWRPFASVMAASLVAHILKNSIAFKNWRRYGDPERNRTSAGESYTEVAQPGPSNQRRSIRPGDKASFKAGVPSVDELEDLSLEIERKWRKLGRRLQFKQFEIARFDHNNEKLVDKAFQMLLAWRRKEGADATYKVLYDALCDKRVQCKELAQQFCCE